MLGSATTGARCRRAAFIGLALLAAASCGGDGGDRLPPDSTIRVDGEIGEWSSAPGVQRLTDDPAGDGRDQALKAAAIAPEADLRSVSAAHDAERLYFLLELGSAPTADKPFEYAVYIDADGKSATGYVVGDEAVGADFVIINGSLLAHASTDRTEWKWTTLDWKVEELDSRPQDHALELSVDRRALQAPGAGVTTLGLLFATIEQRDPTQWEDNITDFSPEKNGRPARLDYRLGPLGPARPAATPRPAVAGVSNYLLYYGAWDRTVIEKVYRYDLVILDPHRGPRQSQIAPVVRRIRAGVNGIPGDQDDVLVLGYISLGEDVRSFDNAPAQPGDGFGPAFWDAGGEQLIYEAQGIASYYLDEKTGAEQTSGQDGLPDRHGTWGACYVNPGDPEWQSFLLGKDGRPGTPYSIHVLIDLLGYQGLFLDTPEVADPWHGYGYTAQGMYEAIAKIRESHPGAVLLLNRGVFFFVPQFPLQFRWNPRKLIDIGLFESHYLDSDYGENAEKPYNLSPFFQGNTVFFDQKVQAELGRTDDSFELMLSLDYAAHPDQLATDHPEIYQQAIASSLQSYGRVPLITTRLVDATPSLTLVHPMPEDVEPPRWGNTTVGFSDLLPTRPPYMVAGYEDRVAKPGRVGLQKAIPGDGRVTLRWDVALDQSLPVKYNVYYSDVWFQDPGQATALRNVTTEMGGDYVDRSLTSADDGCPYQFTVTGLENGRTYYFLLRAEDRLGHQDENLVVLAAAPRPRDPPADSGITIDGVFDDWGAVAGLADAEGEAPQLSPDWVEARFSEDAGFHYVFYETALPLDAAAGQQIFVNTDGQSWTGLRARGGADFVVRGGQLLRYAGTGLDERWTAVAPVQLARDGGRVELRLPRETLAATGEGPVWSFLGLRSNGVADVMPDHGGGFYQPTDRP